jgi:hypothetical protein
MHCHPEWHRGQILFHLGLKQGAEILTVEDWQMDLVSILFKKHFSIMAHFNVGSVPRGC